MMCLRRAGDALKQQGGIQGVHLQFVDWAIVAIYAVLVVTIGLRVARRAGPLLEALDESEAENSPLAAMDPEERLIADFRGTGVTVGPHPMAYKRQQMKQKRVHAVADLARLRDGATVRIAGAVIARQRPGTAKGFVFLSMEDETGVLNAIVAPPLFDRYKLVTLGERFLLIDGTLQNQDGVISVKAGRIAGLREGVAAESHDFH